MSRSKIIIVLGVLVALMPFFGFPSSWESVFEVFIGLGIVVVSVWSTIDRKLTQKAKAHRRQMKKPVEELLSHQEQDITNVSTPSQ